MYKYLLSIFLYLSAFEVSAQINLEVTGRWDFTIPVLDLLEAGNDFPNSYQSLQNQLHLSVGKSDLVILDDYQWQVTAHYSGEDWPEEISLQIRRTGQGVGLDLSEDSLIGGEEFLRLTSVPQVFMEGKNDKVLIPLQYEILNVSVKVPAKTYRTSVMYTITEL